MAHFHFFAKISPRTLRRLAAGLFSLLIILFAWGLTLGLRVDTEPRIPASPAEGIVCQACQLPGQPAHARCAVVLPYQLEEIWAALTDYERYGDICSSIQAAEVTHDPSRPTRIEAHGETFLGGHVPFTVRVNYDRQIDRCSVTWADTGGDVRNRGQWLLTPLGAEETLVELQQDVEVRGAPTFLVRALLLPRLRQTMVSLEQRLNNGPGGKPW